MYLTLGILVLFIGFIYLIRKPRPLAAAPLTGAAPRKDSDILGALSTLYIIPTACVLASIAYEFNNKDKWLEGTEKPALWAFLLRHLMSFFVGVSSVFWIWSPKSVTAWRSLYKRMEPRKQLPVKCQALPLPVLRYAPPNHPHVPAPLSTVSRYSTRSHSHRKPRVHHHRLSGDSII